MNKFFPNSRDKATRQLRRSLANSIREAVKEADSWEKLTDKIEQSTKKVLQEADKEMSDEDFENLVESINKYCKEKLNLCVK